ncbi:MAG TPA: ABC transporter substrate-binding protein [Ilumatobacteraceae bacterium]
MVLSLGLIAAACGKKDDGQTTNVTTGATAATEVPSGDTQATVAAADTTVAATTPATTPAVAVTPGGEITVSGEAEVTNPWLPAAMQCDSYCQQRARSFFDPIAAVGNDDKVHPYLAESITPNADSTQWTIKIRSGISFTDGTPVNADAVIDNIQRSGLGLLLGSALLDVAKVDDPSGATNQDGTPKKILKIEKADDSTFTIFTGKNGDPASPLPWPGFDVYLTGQLGLIASPTWLKAVDADATKATSPVGSGPFIVQSYAPRDALVVTKNPNYWQKDANGVQLPYLDKITFKVIEDSTTAEGALRSGDINIFSDSNAAVIADFVDDTAFPMVQTTQHVETNYLLVDTAKPGPYSDARVRCALSKAVDRQELIDLTGGGLLQPANGVFSPGQEGYLDDNGFNMDQDIDGAKALIADYQKDHPGPVQVTYGHTADRTGDQVADLLKGYWSQIGVDTTVETIPQDQFITNALFGADNFFIYGWRQHAGLQVDEQNFWWNSRGAAPDGALSLNFARINDPIVDDNLAKARSETDPAARKAAAEAVNKEMAKQCFQIPLSYTLWATIHTPAIQGLGQTTLPDGKGTAQDGAGFPGQFWVNGLWLKKG